MCNIENPDHSDFSLLHQLLGGHICLDCHKLTNIYYKDYFNKIKKENKKKEKIESSHHFGLGAVFAIGVMGLIALKKRIF